MTSTTATQEKLALFGGPKSVEITPEQNHDLFHWPIVTDEDEQAVLAVLRAGTTSGIGITQQFEREFAAWQGVEFALASCNGTAALQQAMYGIGLGRGDEMICPSITYWASCIQAYSLGATVVFADVERSTLCIDPADIERRITPRTKAVMVVHAYGHPADMDAILAICRKHNLKVIEDVSHAQGALYKGRMLGTMGDVAAMSMMGAKSFAIGEGGMLITNNRLIYERAIAFGAYERIISDVKDPGLLAMANPPGSPGALPLGGIKGRLNQTCAAMGRVQLKHYPARIQEIQNAMNRFWDLLADVPGVQAHRPEAPRFPNSTMGGWYSPKGLYRPEELGGLPLPTFINALKAEGVSGLGGLNFPLHTHALFNTADVYNDGKPTRIAFVDQDIRQSPESLPVAMKAAAHGYTIPWFKKDRPALIEQFAAAFRKVASQADELLKQPR